VVLAGSERWLPGGLGRGLRDYVTRGGRLASLGADSLRRRVVVGRDVLRAATGPRPADLFGERIRSSRVAPGPLVPERDAIGLFGGLAGFPGSFSRLDRSLDLPAGARPLVLAGRTPGEPAFVAYRLGRGIVVRVGTAEWASELRGSRADVGVARVTARIWRLLAGSR
jgi:hypothetical protein